MTCFEALHEIEARMNQLEQYDLPAPVRARLEAAHNQILDALEWTSERTQKPLVKREEKID